MELGLVQVDAFTQDIFGGNSAAVVVLDEWLSDELMQKIAAENNLSETVFVRRELQDFSLRWFTPEVEVDLCGHATLAAAYVLFKDNIAQTTQIEFESKSGPLFVARQGDRIFMDFPARAGVAVNDYGEIEDALGLEVREVFQARDTLVIVENQEQVRACRPDFAALAVLDTFAVIVSAPGEDCDFVSRFFAPAAGINEDPVTGSAHCTLIPYWAQRLQRNRLHARQLSKRGGELFCEDTGERVLIGGDCREYMRARIFIPD